MKSRFTKTISFMLAIIMCISVLSVPAYATDTTDAEKKLVLNGISPQSSEPMLIDGLENAGDSATYEMEIDHALYPEAILCAFTYGLPGNVVVRVYNDDEEGSYVSGVYLQAYLNEKLGDKCATPKGYCTITSSEATVKKYKILVTAETDNAIYAMNIATKDTITEGLGGVGNTTAVTKNIPTSTVEGTKNAYLASYQALLEGEGDWYYYVADGYTYITARVSNRNDLAFEVIDATTYERVFASGDDDRGISYSSSYGYDAYVQGALNLVSGRDYFIHFYSTSNTHVTDTTMRYYVHIGLPYLSTERINYSAPKSFSVPANQTTTFYVTIPKGTYPSSARACSTTTVRFTSGSLTSDAYIESCQVTAPNGEIVTLSNGRYQKFEEPSSVKYLTDTNHVPIAGTWKITIKASKALNCKFSLSGYYMAIMGRYGNTL